MTAENLAGILADTNWPYLVTVRGNEHGGYRDLRSAALAVARITARIGSDAAETHGVIDVFDLRNAADVDRLHALVAD